MQVNDKLNSINALHFKYLILFLRDKSAQKLSRQTTSI
jgi:hypothetical protein